MVPTRDRAPPRRGAAALLGLAVLAATVAVATVPASAFDGDGDRVQGFDGGAPGQVARGADATAVAGSGLDYGDAPDPPYPTEAASDGARHRDVGRAWLGRRVDAEDTADTPDGDEFDDGLLGLGDELRVRVTNEDHDGPLYLNALMDLDVSGDWEGDEEWIVENERVAVPPGETAVVTVDVDVPPVIRGLTGAVPPRTLRLTVTGEPLSDYDGRGSFAVGETEDYRRRTTPWEPPGDAPPPRRSRFAFNCDWRPPSGRVYLHGTPVGLTCQSDPPADYTGPPPPPAGFHAGVDGASATSDVTTFDVGDPGPGNVDTEDDVTAAGNPPTFTVATFDSETHRWRRSIGTASGRFTIQARDAAGDPIAAQTTDFAVHYWHPPPIYVPCKDVRHLPLPVARAITRIHEDYNPAAEGGEVPASVARLIEPRTAVRVGSRRAPVNLRVETAANGAVEEICVVDGEGLREFDPQATVTTDVETVESLLGADDGLAAVGRALASGEIAVTSDDPVTGLRYGVAMGLRRIAARLGGDRYDVGRDQERRIEYRGEPATLERSPMGYRVVDGQGATRTASLWQDGIAPGDETVAAPDGSDESAGRAPNTRFRVVIDGKGAPQGVTTEGIQRLLEAGGTDEFSTRSAGVYAAPSAAGPAVANEANLPGFPANRDTG